MLSDWMDDFGAFGGSPLYLAVTALFIAMDRPVGMLLLYGFVIAYAVTAALRAVFFKERPKNKKHVNWIEKMDAGSFPSFHAMKATMLAGFVGYLFLDPLPWGIITICWLFACMNRIESKKHHISDVVVGVVIGVLIVLGLNMYLLQ